MNFQLDDMTGALRNRERANGNPMGSSLADVDPMKIDSKVSKVFFCQHNFFFIPKRFYQ